MASAVTMVVLTLLGEGLFAWLWESPFASVWAFVRALAWLLGGSIAIVAAVRWRVVIDADGFRCSRWWCVVPSRFARFSTGSHVDAVDDWDMPDWWWVEIRGGEKTFDFGRSRDAHDIAKALHEAVARHHAP
jgi:hypothetical protein